MSAIQKRNLLDPARVDRMSLEHRMLHEAHARIDIRMRKHLEQMRNDELCSSEVDEPVGDDGDFRSSYHTSLVCDKQSLDMY